MIYVNFFSQNNDVLYLETYYPYRISNGEVNPNFNNFSRSILNLKDKKTNDIKIFFDRIDSLLTKENIVICVVPSSDSSKIDSGIKRLAQKISGSKERSDGTSCLRRYKTVKKAAHGGSRDIDVHLNSIKVTDGSKIRGKKVLLLDDVCTTGNSLSACEKLLREAGALEVQKVALGLTYREGR